MGVPHGHGKLYFEDHDRYDEDAPDAEKSAFIGEF